MVVHHRHMTPLMHHIADSNPEASIDLCYMFYTYTAVTTPREKGQDMPGYHNLSFVNGFEVVG